MPWVEVMMDGKRFEALTHALHEIKLCGNN